MTATALNPSTRDRHAVRRAEGMGSFALALLMHLLLAAMLLFGLRWQTQPPVAVQAELWTAPPPRPVLPEVRPEPPPQPAPREIAPPAPRPVEMPAPPKVDIAIEEQKQKERERLERERIEREVAAQRKLEAKKLAEAQARKDAEARKALEARKEAEARKVADARKQAEAKKDAEAKKEADARKALEARKAAEARKLAEARQDEQTQERSRADHVKRLLEQAGGERTTGKAGAAVGAEAGGVSGAALGIWGGKVSSHIRANTIFQIPPDLRGNPKAEFSVSVLPDGTIANLKLIRSSGVPSWDQAAERAIRRSDPLPRPPVGAPRDISIVQGPRDE